MKITTTMLDDELYEASTPHQQKVRIDMRPEGIKEGQSPTELLLSALKDINAATFMKYVSERTQANEHEVAESLRSFSTGLKNEISTHAKAALPGIGNFFVDENGNTIFEQEELPGAFHRSVTAIRVIHPNAEHTMLVGDRETTNTP